MPEINYVTRIKGTAEVITQLETIGDRIDATGLTAKTAGKKTESAFDSVGVSMSQVKSLAAGLGITFTALGAVQLFKNIINEAIAFESSFAGVRKTVDATEEEFAQLAAGFRRLALEIPISVNELNKIGEAAGQLGIKKENILAFTRVMADLAVTTNLSSDQAATSLARLANITGMNQTQFSNLGSAIVALGNNFATTEAEIVEMSLRLAGAGKQIGLTEAQTLGFAAALSSVGIEAEAGGTALSRVFVEIEKNVATGGKQLNLFAQVAGVSTAEFSKAFKQDAAGAVLSFIDGLDRMQKSGKSMSVVLEALGMDNVRVSDALKRMASSGDLARDAIELSTKAFKENTALVEEANKRYATTEAQLQLLKNTLSDIAISLGTVFLPAINAVTKSLSEVIQATMGLLTESGKWKEFLKYYETALIYGPVAALQLYAKVQKETAGETDKTAAATKTLAEKLAIYDEMVRKAKASTGFYEDDIKELTDAQKKLIETTQKALRPMDDLAKKLDEQMKLGFSKKDLVAAYAGEIVKAADRQGELGKTLSKTSVELVSMARNLKPAFDDKGAAKNLDNAIKSLNSQVDDFLDNLKKTNPELARFGGLLSMAAPPHDQYDDMVNFNKAVSDLNRHLGDTTATLATGAIPISLEQFGIKMAVAKKESEGLSDVLSKQVSTIFTDLNKKLAENVLAWKGWGQSVLDSIKAFGEAALRTLFETFLSPFQKIMGNLSGQIAGALSGKGFNAGSILSGVGGIASTAFGIGLPSLAAVTAGTAATAAAGAGLLAGAAIPTGLAAGGAAAGGTAATGAGAWGSIGALATNPITIAAAGALSAYALYRMFTQGAAEAGSKEVQRDLGLAGVSEQAMKGFYSSVGLSEKDAYGIRKELMTSPLFLTQFAAPLAEQTGQMETFLKSLEKVTTSWGTFNLRTAFEAGAAAGDFTELNRVWEETIGRSERLAQIMPDFATKLAAVSKEAESASDAFLGLVAQFMQTGIVSEELSELIQANNGDLAAFQEALRIPELEQTRKEFARITAELEKLQPKQEDMIARFLRTGEVSDELREKIESLGGSAEVFDEFSRLRTVKADFEDLSAQFIKTGAGLEELRLIFQEFGGDLGVLEEASKLPALYALKGEFAALKAEIDKLIPKQEDAITKFLKTGEVTDELAEKIMLAGGNIETFKRFAEMKEVKANFESLVATFKNTGSASQDLIDLITQYGDASIAAGGITKENIDSIANTVRTNLNTSFVSAATSLSTELGKMTTNLSTSIDSIMAKLQTEMTNVGNSISTAFSNSTAALVAELKTIDQNLANTINNLSNSLTSAVEALVATINKNLGSIEAPSIKLQIEAPEIPEIPEIVIRGRYDFGDLPMGGMESYQSGGYVHETGPAFLHAGETVIPAGKSVGPEININISGPIYGMDDLDKVIAGSIQRTRRLGGLSHLAY